MPRPSLAPKASRSVYGAARSCSWSMRRLVAVKRLVLVGLARLLALGICVQNARGVLVITISATASSSTFCLHLMTAGNSRTSSRSDVGAGTAWQSVGCFPRRRGPHQILAIRRSSPRSIGCICKRPSATWVGGIALQLDDSIEEGDWIELERQGQGPRVRQIRWRDITVIETRAGDTLMSRSRALGFSLSGSRNATVRLRPTGCGSYFSVGLAVFHSEVIQIVNAELQSAPIQCRGRAESTLHLPRRTKRTGTASRIGAPVWPRTWRPTTRRARAVRGQECSRQSDEPNPVALPERALFISHATAIAPSTSEARGRVPDRGPKVLALFRAPVRTKERLRIAEGVAFAVSTGK